MTCLKYDFMLNIKAFLNIIQLQERESDMCFENKDLCSVPTIVTFKVYNYKCISNLVAVEVRRILIKIGT